MEQYAGLDVSLESTSVCVVDASGRVVREAKVSSEPEALIAWFAEHGTAMARIGLEAGPLSQWLYAAMEAAGLPVELLETRHVRSAFKAMTIKTDRKDALGIAHLMRMGWFRPVHCKSVPSRSRPSSMSATGRATASPPQSSPSRVSTREIGISLGVTGDFKYGNLQQGTGNWARAVLLNIVARLTNNRVYLHIFNLFCVQVGCLQRGGAYQEGAFYV